jgi:glycosyltransferase involved in cell wall biosynthesis
VTLRAPADLVPPAPPARVNPAAMDIHWVVPDFSRGSGGHMTIFRMVRFLELFGHRCTIWIEAPTHHKTAAAAHDDIVKYFQCVAARVAFIEDGFFAATGDAVIATGWSTAYPVSRATGFAARYYFVQDHEPEFYPTGTDARLARLSYGLDLACICASPWLDGIMSGRYGRWARHFHLAYDPEHYRIIDEEAHARRFPARRKAAATKDEPVRIAVYARDHTARRCVALALIALETLGAKGAPIEVHFFGQRDLPFFQTNFTAFNHGVLDAPDLAALYNRCDIGICFSATNYSLVPQEMMACGLPVVELDGESTRAIFPEGVVTFAGPSPEDIAAKLEALVADPKARRAQMLKALDWVRGFSWEGAARKVEGAITAYLGERALAAPPVARPSEVLLDVVIPTYNGMNELKPVIEALRGQRGREAIRVHCIDSSSGDGTTEWLRAQPDINLTVIDKREFQHGRTRNWGAAMGTAPLIAFLTQDAMPATDTWAQDIVMMFDHHPEAAGLFGRHLPYPNHPEFVREEITTHFQNMLKHPLALSKNTDPERWERGDIGWRQLLHFYSDNNSAMRRRVWQDIPYPEVPYGEDQVWARDIIEAGHVKLYAPTATVYHSHDYDPDETYARSKIEGEFFFTHFGYRLGDGTAEQLDRRIEREQAIFRRRALVRGMPADEIEMRVANIAAKHRGWRDGLAAGEAAAQKGKAT